MFGDIRLTSASWHALCSSADHTFHVIAKEASAMFQRILVAIDFSPASDAALERARALAAQFDGRLHLVHVLENDFLRPMAGDPRAVEGNLVKWLQDRLTDDDRRRGATVTVLKSDQTAEVLLARARETHADLIVLGTHGRSNLAHALRPSVAERLVREAPCPVLTSRPVLVHAAAG